MTRSLLLIAAAGTSARMGLPKALLPYRFDDAFGDDDTFGGHLVRGALDVVDDIVVTVPEDAAVADAIAAVVASVARDDLGRVRCLRNRAPRDGLSGSLATALDVANDDVDVFLWCPVDVPFADSGVFRALVAAVRAGATDAAVVVVDGVWGHPVACARPLFARLGSAAPHGGPRGILTHDGVTVREITHSDRRLRLNLNTDDDVKNAKR
jgi:CTP:molybdopterin cytidylyltransferase MocA